MMASMTDPTEQHRFYVDLAPWWPLISPPQEYEEEAAFAAKIIETASIPVREVLELGSGGGHNAVYLKAKFALTLVDLSAQMILQSQLLNPECEHHVGDMRTVRLGREFDAVFVHDAVDYMTTEGDLRLAIQTAFAHCRPGGVAVFVPDDTVETFEPGTDHGGSDSADGRGVRYLEWTWDPDPSDTWVATEYAFLLREGPEPGPAGARDPSHGRFSPARSGCGCSPRPDSGRRPWPRRRPRGRPRTERRATSSSATARLDRQ